MAGQKGDAKTQAPGGTDNYDVLVARYLEAASVAAALELPAGASIFDPTGPLARRVRALPGVLDAEVGRRLPGTLRIRVRETEPIALARSGNRLVLVDEAGTVLPFDPASPAADLPLAAADSVVTGVLARIRDAEPELFGRIQRAARYRSDVVVDLDRGRFFLRGGAGPDDIQALTLVAGLLDREGRSWRELDGRFPPRIVVRARGASRG